MKDIQVLKNQSIEWLKQLIAIPSFSTQEQGTANLLCNILHSYGISYQRFGNNILVKNKNQQKGVPHILLNSHHDTVKSGMGWLTDPFNPILKEDILYGLGSNDAGGSLVGLLATFIYFYEHNLPYNLIGLWSAEEEISGPNGVRMIVDELMQFPIDVGIVGEPTEMNMAIAEKGLLVLDCIAKGKTGHAARDEGVNALYLAIDDIHWFKTHQFPKVSDFLGQIKATVTQINAGNQHNVVPDTCHFVVDIRTNECYSNAEVLEYVGVHIQSTFTPRSTYLNSSKIDPSHPLVKKGIQMGLGTYGSPTLSDQSLMPFNTIKIGPGKSERSHTPNEFILCSEIFHGIDTYIDLLKDFSLNT